MPSGSSRHARAVRPEAAARLGGLDMQESIKLQPVFSAFSLRRIRLKHDQQVREWQCHTNR